MDKDERKGSEQLRSSSLREIDWPIEAIEAALDCMWSPKTTKGQKSYRENMRLALTAALSIAHPKIKEHYAKICEEDNSDEIMQSYGTYYATKIRKLG